MGKVAAQRVKETQKREEACAETTAKYAVRNGQLEEKLLHMRSLILSPENKQKYADDPNWKQAIVDRVLANGKRIKSESDLQREEAFKQQVAKLDQATATRNAAHTALAKELK